jgi:hypothetical protein
MTNHIVQCAKPVNPLKLPWGGPPFLPGGTFKESEVINKMAMFNSFNSMLIDNPHLTRVSELGREWYEDRNGQEYYYCDKCGELTPENLLTDDDYICQKCYDKIHTCAYCGEESKKELTRIIDGHYHCDGCAADVLEARKKDTTISLRRIKEKLETEPGAIDAEYPREYAYQIGAARAVMLYAAKSIGEVIDLLEGR